MIVATAIEHTANLLSRDGMIAKYRCTAVEIALRSADDPRRPLRYSSSPYLRVCLVVAPRGRRGLSASALTLLRRRCTRRRRSLGWLTKAARRMI